MALLAGSAGATTVDPSPPPLAVAVDTGPGDQSDAHIDGDMIVYTDELNGGSQVRYASPALSGIVPKAPLDYDFLPDVQGTRIVVTRLTEFADIVFWDAAGTAAPVVLAPTPAPDRRAGRIGGTTVVWQELFATTASSAEIVAYDLDSGLTQRLTTDNALDEPPNISPDGNTVVWTKCDNVASGCHVWTATRTNGIWTSHAVTSGAVEDHYPDTDGSWIVFDRNLSVIVATAIVGSESRVLTPPAGFLSGLNVSRGVVGLAMVPPGGVWNDVYAWDVARDRLRRVTQTNDDESLAAVSVDAGGTAKMTWTRSGSAGLDIYKASFPLPVATALEANPVVARVGPGLNLYLKLSARVTRLDGGSAVGGVPVTFVAGGTSCVGTTDASGTAACTALTNVLASVPGGYNGSFAGNAQYDASAAHGKILTVNGQPLL